jgi:decaprenylphospho-beta-D-ribofuranose 2-oxidase
LILRKNLPKISLEREKLSSFDNGVKEICAIAKPDRFRHWASVPSDAYQISRGAGLSLSAASFETESLSVSHDRFNRILDFDLMTGEVEVEAGIRLFSLHNFLVANGYFLPIQPGHGQISVGGCVAADIHGKNQVKDGNFIEQVVSLKLFHPEHGVLNLSRELNSALFFLTCGGYGLTGHILSVRLKAQLLPSQVVITRTQRFPDIDTGLQLLNNEAFKADFIHSWHDFSQTGKKFGSGMVFMSNFEVIEGYKRNLSKPRSVVPKSLSSRHRMPAANLVVNRFSIATLNSAYKKINSTNLIGKQSDIADALFPIHHLQGYYYFLGSHGYHEYQILLPKNVAADYLKQLGAVAAELKIPITLASAKIFGGTQNLIRFSGEGVCFALNFLRSRQANVLLDWLDSNLVSYGGRPNLIKDSRLPRQIAEACYPEIDEFRIKLRNFDPKRLFRSEMSERLGL